MLARNWSPLRSLLSSHLSAARTSRPCSNLQTPQRDILQHKTGHSVITRPDLTSAWLPAETGRRPRPQDDGEACPAPGPARCKSTGCCRWEHPALPGTSRNQLETRQQGASGGRGKEVMRKTSVVQFVTFLPDNKIHFILQSVIFLKIFQSSRRVSTRDWSC